MAKGIAALNQRVEVGEQDLQDVLRVGMDCLPEHRRRLIVAALKGENANSVPMPSTVRERQVEELQALDIFQAASHSLSPKIERLLLTVRLDLN